MARRQTVAEIEKRLAFAKKREAYFKTNPQKSTYDAQPRAKYGYYSTSLGTATASTLFIVDVSVAAVALFGTITALKLLAGDSVDLVGASRPPKGFIPAKISAVIGDATPTKVTAKTTDRKYVKYSRNASGSAQASYTAPIGGTAPLVTTKEQVATAKAIKTAINGTLTEYGRVYFTPEVYNSSLE